MKKKTWMIGLAGAVILAAAAGSCSSGSTETKSVTAATTAAAAESEADGRDLRGEREERRNGQHRAAGSAGSERCCNHSAGICDGFDLGRRHQGSDRE